MRLKIEVAYNTTRVFSKFLVVLCENLCFIIFTGKREVGYIKRVGIVDCVVYQLAN